MGGSDRVVHLAHAAGHRRGALSRIVGPSVLEGGRKVVGQVQNLEIRIGRSHGELTAHRQLDDDATLAAERVLVGSVEDSVVADVDPLVLGVEHAVAVAAALVGPVALMRLAVVLRGFGHLDRHRRDHSFHDRHGPSAEEELVRVGFVEGDPVEGRGLHGPELEVQLAGGEVHDLALGRPELLAVHVDEALLEVALELGMDRDPARAGLDLGAGVRVVGVVAVPGGTAAVTGGQGNSEQGREGPMELGHGLSSRPCGRNGWRGYSRSG